jgi:hypothetical protein
VGDQWFFQFPAAAALERGDAAGHIPHASHVHARDAAHPDDHARAGAIAQVFGSALAGASKERPAEPALPAKHGIRKAE